MDYEKKYKEALERAKAFELPEYKNIAESIFPELQKSEDEKIKEEIKVVLANTDLSRFALDYTFADMLTWLEKQGKSSDQIHYWTEEEIEPIISDYLRGAEHYGGMIGRLRCLKPKSLEKQDNSSIKWQKNTPHNKPAINHSVLMKTIQGIAEGEWQGEDWFQYRWSWTLKDSDVLAWMELSDLDEQGEQNPTSDIKYEVKNGGSLSVNGKPFDYEKATITQNDFASVGETATIELSSPIDCGDRIYHVSHKPIEKNGEQKQEWSEEDEGMKENIEGALDCYESMVNEDWGKEKEWLTSIKSRIQPQPKEWSDKDEKMYINFKHLLDQEKSKFSYTTAMYNGIVLMENWLKSIKDRIGG